MAISVVANSTQSVLEKLTPVILWSLYELSVLRGAQNMLGIQDYSDPVCKGDNVFAN